MKALLQVTDAEGNVVTPGRVLKTSKFHDRYSISRMNKLFELPKAPLGVLEPRKQKSAGKQTKKNTRQSRKAGGVDPRERIRVELTPTIPTPISVAAQQITTSRTRRKMKLLTDIGFGRRRESADV